MTFSGKEYSKHGITTKADAFAGLRITNFAVITYHVCMQYLQVMVMLE